MNPTISLMPSIALAPSSKIDDLIDGQSFVIANKEKQTILSENTILEGERVYFNISTKKEEKITEKAIKEFDKKVKNFLKTKNTKLIEKFFKSFAVGLLSGLLVQSVCLATMKIFIK